jgi:Ca-activated chloride channel family protein
MRSIILLLGFIYLMSLSVFSQAGEEDKSLSPYFLVKSENGTADQMPLKHTAAKVNIAGVIADVEITQVYQNEGEVPLEATYVFPASTRAAVFAMEMRVGYRRIKAQIKERDAARQLYEAAKEEGKTASLLEQERPNIFTMNVANILPGDSIVVKLSYTELLKPEKGIYEFVYPTVVGPRYTGPQGEPDPEETVVPTSQPQKSQGEIPYTQEGEAPSYTFGFEATLSAGMPIQRVMSPSHKVQVDFRQGNEVAKIHLDESELKGGKKDFVLRYRLSGDAIQPGVLTYEENGEKFFLLMMQPPKLVEPEAIPPREYVFVVDVSGSMSGFPLNTSKELMLDLLKNIRQTDRFNILFFAGSNIYFAPKSVEATPENIKKAGDFMLSQRGGGGTNLYNAMKGAIDLEGTENYSRHIIAVTDGYISAETSVFDLVRDNLNEANVWSFGIGSSVNRFLIEGLAHVGKGEPLIVLNGGEAAAQAKKFREYIETPALTNVKVDFGLSDVYALEPSYVPDVMAERPILVMGKYRGELTGDWQISGLSGQDNWTGVIPMDEKVRPKRRNRALRYLWARERIKLLGDYARLRQDSATVKEITQLGLDYNLLTAYTSFVAIDERIRNKSGQDTSVTQPLPLPEGVSNQAVGNQLQSQVSGISIRGAVSGSTNYYVDGMKIRGSASTMSLSEVAIVGVHVQPKNAVAYTIPLSEGITVIHNQQMLSLIAGAAGIQQGAGNIYMEGLPMMSGMGNYYHVQNLPYGWANYANILFAGSSQMQGYDAPLGGLNLGLWNPYRSALSAEFRGDAFGDLSLSLKGKYKFNDHISTRLLVDGNDFRTTIDRNEDGFQDADNHQHLKLMNIWNGSHFSRKLTWSGGVYYHQDKRNGGQLEQESIPTNSLFDWNWDTRHVAAFGKANFKFGNEHSLSFNGIFQDNQNSGVFGPQLYAGAQRHLESQLLYEKHIMPGLNSLRLGGGILYRNTSTLEFLDQLLLRREESVPGALAKAMFTRDKLVAEGEFRVDNHNLYGLLLHPRFAVKYRIGGYVDGSLGLNATAYRGTRPANLLSQNQRFMQSNRAWIAPSSDFVPDQGWKYNLSATYTHRKTRHVLDIGASYTYGHYTSLMLTDVWGGNMPIQFYAADEIVRRHMISAFLELKLWNKLGFKGHYYFDDFQLPFDRGLTQQPFSPRHRGFATLYYQSKHKDGYRPWTTSVTAQYVGEQYIPYRTEMTAFDWTASASDPFFTLSTEVRREFKKWYLFGGVENLLDYRQEQLVLAPEAVGSDDFDAGLVWGPALGRRMYGGIGVRLEK